MCISRDKSVFLRIAFIQSEKKKENKIRDDYTHRFN